MLILPLDVLGIVFEMAGLKLALKFVIDHFATFSSLSIVEALMGATESSSLDELT